MKRLFVGLSLVLLLQCSSHTQKETELNTNSDGVKLTLTAHPRQGFTPFHVSFTARLSGVSENSQDHYCLQEEWDFGDGAVSSQQPNCAPYSDTAKIEHEFFADHVFADPGSYTVRFVLGVKENEVRSNPLQVTVLEGQPNLSD
jgi:hypothetical protein